MPNWTEHKDKRLRGSISGRSGCGVSLEEKSWNYLRSLSGTGTWRGSAETKGLKPDGAWLN